MSTTTSTGDFNLQMPENPRSQLEVIAGEYDPDKSQRRGGIIRLTVDVPSAHAAGETRTPRWRTPEFILYYVVFISATLWMIYVPMQLSSSAYFLILRHIIMLKVVWFQRHIPITACIAIG
jgi:protein-cysteine N-palmitoyltransferase HHAT